MPSARITYFGHSTVLLVTESGRRIMFDPWLEGNPSCPENLHTPGPLDVIALSHGHSDHTTSALRLAKETGAKVACTFELGMLLVKDGLPSTQYLPMNKGGTIPLDGGLSVTLTQAYHSSSYDALDGNTYYAGEPCGIVLRLESGRSVYFAGDTLLFGDMSLIAKRHHPVLALLPIGDRFTMGPEEAAEATALLAPSIVVPIHYNTFPALSGTAEAFTAAVSRHAPASSARILEPGAELEF